MEINLYLFLQKKNKIYIFFHFSNLKIKKKLKIISF